MSRFLTIPFVLVVIVSLVLTTPVNGTIVIKVRLRTSPSPNNVLLECQDTMNTPLPNAVFQRALGSSDQFMSFNYTSSDEFVVTPQIEGRYRCQDGGMTSNAIDLVAYPMFDPDRLQQLSEPITAFLLKSSPTINCVVLEGALSQFYSVEWWKGTTLVYNSTNNPANSPRFSVQELGLVIQNVTGSDASEGYFCRVTVLDPIESRTTTVVGINTALVVIDDISITSGLSDHIVSEGGNITHMCTAVSLPAPVLVWRINGVPISSERQSRYRVIAGTTTTDGSVTSSLEVTNMVPSDSVLIECVAINTAGDIPQVISSKSQVTVITKPFNPTLENNDGGVILTIQFPTNITEAFFLSLRFTNTTGGTMERSTITISDITFLNTNSISYTIPEKLLPRYAMFSVSVALIVDGKMGAYSTASNKISVQSGGTTGTTESPTPSGSSSTTHQTVIIALIVVIILLVLLGVGCIIALVVVLMKKKSPPSSVHDADAVRYRPTCETVELKEHSTSGRCHSRTPSDYTSSSSRYTHSPTPHSSHSSLSCTSYSSGTSGRSRSVSPMDNPHRREDTTSQKSDLFDEPEQVKEKPRQQPPPCQSRETPISEGGKRKSREGSAPKLDERKRSHTEVAMSAKPEEDKRKSSEGIARSHHGDYHHHHHHHHRHRHHNQHHVSSTESPISPSHAASMPVLEQSAQSTVESLENSLKNSHKLAPISASTMIPPSSATAAATAISSTPKTSSQVVYLGDEAARKEKERAVEESKSSSATAVTLTTQKLDSNESNEEDEFIMVEFQNDS